MTFRNRKITNTHADNIAEAIATSRYSADWDAADAAAQEAVTALEEAVEALAHTMPARNAWLALTEEQKLAVDDRCHNFYWRNEPNVYVEHEVVNFSHNVEMKDFRVLPRGEAEGTLSYFTDDWQKWDFFGQMETAIKALPEHAAYVATSEVFQKARSNYFKVQHELCMEMQGRSTKDVIAAWPEVEAIIHTHYGYSPTSPTASTITAPMDTVIANALTPAITMAAE
tara:strand:+ start:263 stop:943 length:681 start_codon:yes stop_codon:yes gene_type:complete